MSRSATCKDCGTAFLTLSSTGRLPERCSTCNPNYAASYREEVLVLRARVELLERRLAQGMGAAIVPGADRRALAQAVRAVAEAEGRLGTWAALLHLRDVAHTWADVLTTVHETEPPAQADMEAA